MESHTGTCVSHTFFEAETERGHVRTVLYPLHASGGTLNFNGEIMIGPDFEGRTCLTKSPEASLRILKFPQGFLSFSLGFP